MVAAGRYPKDKREKIIDKINAWVKADINSLDENCSELLAELCDEEKKYICDFYQPKEPQFCRAYTQTYLNLGVHSTQRNESYHVVVKQKLHKHMPIVKAVQSITTKTAELGRKYDKLINQNRRSNLRLMDTKAFAHVGSKLTHYAIEMAMRELSAAKRLVDQVAEGWALDFELKKPCTKGCQAPLRYGIPCQHWLYIAVADNIPVPISLFHPRWLLDGPAFLKERWVMSWDETQQLTLEQSSRYAGDRFSHRGADLILESALTAIEKHKSLPAGQAENYASKFAKGTSHFNIQQDERTASLALLPLTLPEPLVEPNLCISQAAEREQ